MTRTLDEPLDDRPVIDTSRNEVITQVYDITTGSQRAPLRVTLCATQDVVEPRP